MVDLAAAGSYSAVLMRNLSRPILTLTSDFGQADHYVAVMKAAILRHCPDAHLIDVTHQIAPQDILAASFTLAQTIAGFPAGTVHLAVVDPTVGTRRRILIVEANKQFIICPDNGLITWTWRCHRRCRAYAVTRRFSRVSSTFHGRDIMAPLAGMLAAGSSLADLARPIQQPRLLNIAPSRSRSGVILHIDHFGNATTNIPQSLLASRRVHNVRVHKLDLGPLRRTYADVAPSQPLALIGSSGLLEIAVRNASAARQLDLHIGDEVHLQWTAKR